MNRDFPAADEIMRAGLGRVYPAAQLVIRHDGAPVFSAAYGDLTPDARPRPTTPDDAFRSGVRLQAFHRGHLHGAGGSGSRRPRSAGV